MMILLPFIALVLLFGILQARSKNGYRALLSACVVWGVILTAITEVLSLLRLLEFGWLVTLWLMVDFGLIAILGQTIGKGKLQISRFNKLTFSRSTIFPSLLIGQTTLIVLIIGCIAVAAAPNHSDSMEYHMSRVVHWIQNRSLAHYPTHTPEQLYQNPWSEYVIAHFQILSGGDYFANLVQWGSMVGCIVGVALIAKQVGANLRGQVLAAVFCATIPMGILQGSSTNNDYVVAFWLVCFAYFTLTTMQEGISSANTLQVGASLGLAILSKGTAYIYAFPIGVWLLLWALKKQGWKAWKPILAALVVMLALNLSHYTRNVLIFGSPLGLSTGETNGEFSLAIFIASIAKNLSLHADIVRNLHLQGLITPTTGLTHKAITILHERLGLDVNDPQLLNPKISRFFVSSLSTHEDTAGNPLHLLLIGIASVVAIARTRVRKQPYVLGYLIVLLAGFLLFCFLFTWSPWRCRLHLPLFVLFSVIVGVAFSRSLNYRITNILAVLLLMLSYPWVFQNSTRPLIASNSSNSFLDMPRASQYFVTQPQLEAPYQAAIATIQAQQCNNIGLFMEDVSFEYPLWILAQQNGYSTLIQHVQVNNASNSLSDRPPFNQFEPCATIAVRRVNEEGKSTIQVSVQPNS